MFRGVGEYARKRYFKDFTKKFIFVETSETEFKLGLPEIVCNALERFGLYVHETLKPEPEVKE